MRTTLAIDDDVLLAAKHLAEVENRTLGGVISDLARRALTPSIQPRPPTRNGILLLPDRDNVVPVTLEFINQMRDEMP